MADKYNFESLSKWSVSVISYHCESSSFISTCSDSDLDRLAYIAHYENIASSSDSPSPLLRTLQTKWLKLLKDNEQLSISHAPGSDQARLRCFVRCRLSKQWLWVELQRSCNLLTPVARLPCALTIRAPQRQSEWIIYDCTTFIY